MAVFVDKDWAREFEWSSRFGGGNSDVDFTSLTKRNYNFTMEVTIGRDMVKFLLQQTDHSTSA